MRPIDVSTEVFSAIWRHRIAGEETEDAILRRLLVGGEPKEELRARSGASRTKTKVLWREDVREALLLLGGSAPLEHIYQKVKEIRLRAGRRIPRSIDAIVRRELEYNSSDSESYTKRHDWFYSVNGIGAGVWGIRA